MSLGIDIKVDAPGALPTIAGVEAALAKVEAKGPAVGDALSKGLGAGAPAADKTKQSTEGLTEKLTALSNLGKNFGGALADQFKREADMLDKIHGPATKYASDLQALDGLMMRGAISTQEYAQQVAKMNQAIEQTPEKTDEATSSADKLGEAFEALKIPALGAGFLELGHKIADMADEAHRLEDEYTVLTNKALKFEDATHNQQQIIADMGALAGSLHTTREVAFELYDTVRDGTDGMRVSYAEQAKMAKEFGLANELAGNSVDQAADSLKRFMYDVASGTVDIRAIRQQMIEVPEIADVWTGAFHTTRNGLFELLDSGKLTMRDLAMAFVKPSEALDELDKKASKIATTNAAAMKKWAEDVNVSVQQGMSGIQAVRYQQLDPKSFEAYQVKYGRAEGEDRFFGDQGQEQINKMLQQAEDIKNLTGAWSAMGDAKDKAIKASLQEIIALPTHIKDVTTAVEDLGRKFGAMTDQWDTGMTTFGRSTKIVMDNAAKIGEAKQQLEALRVVMKNGGEGADTARKEYEALMTTLNDGRLPATIKIWDSLHDAVRTYNEDLAATNALYKSSAISALDYEYELLQLAKANPGIQHLNEIIQDNVKRYDEAAASAKKYADAARLGFDSPAAHGMTVGITGHELNANALNDAAFARGADKTGDEKLTQQLKEYERVVESIQSPLAKYRDEINQLNEDYKTGAIPLDLYAKAVHKLTKEQYDAFEGKATDAVSGLDKGLKEITNTTLNLGATITQSVTGAFSKMNESIIQMVTTGKADFGQLADFIEQALAKIALQEIEIGIIGALAPGAGAGAAIAGSWAGSDTTIPHAANGYAGKVGGVGGTDTRLFAAMVTPGETVSIRTPEQNAAAQRQAGAPNITVVNKHDTRGELAQGLSSGAFDTHIVNVMRRNAGAVQSIIKK